MSSVENKIIAERLREAATLLEQQEANRFRVAAYRRAADTIESLPQRVGLVLRTEGFQGLTALPGIGTQIGGAIAEVNLPFHSSTTLLSEQQTKTI